ncbi:hypothetical protein DL546_008359 [Coniochaeta pulveracea]|nr:hypothetical protein DL546_008359 [Coniochaeta pulveracea]
MLSAAQSTLTPEYAQVHEFIRARMTRKANALALRSLRDPPPPKPHSAPNPNTIPLLTRVSGPGEPPHYEPTVRPRPLAELGGTGIRRVPTLENAAGIPYLRQTKPQTLIMNRIIRQKSEKLQKKVYEAMELLEEPREAARYEDTWDKLIDKELGVRGDDRDPPGSYTRTNQQALDSVFDYLNKSRADQAARGAALHRIVQEERALRDQERIERMRRREREARRAAGDSSAPDAAQVEALPQATVAKSSMDIAKQLAAEVAGTDPFIDPARREAVGTSPSKTDESVEHQNSSNSRKSVMAKPAQRTKNFAGIRKVGSTNDAPESANADSKRMNDDRKSRRRRLVYNPTMTADGGRGGASF